MAFLIRKKNKKTGIEFYLLGNQRNAPWGTQRHKPQRFATEAEAQALEPSLTKSTDEEVAVVEETDYHHRSTLT